MDQMQAVEKFSADKLVDLLPPVIGLLKFQEMVKNQKDQIMEN